MRGRKYKAGSRRSVRTGRGRRGRGRKRTVNKRLPRSAGKVGYRL